MATKFYKFPLFNRDGQQCAEVDIPADLADFEDALIVEWNSRKFVYEAQLGKFLEAVTYHCRSEP